MDLCALGPMDKAPDYGSGDCRFESCRARHFLAPWTMESSPKASVFLDISNTNGRQFQVGSPQGEPTSCADSSMDGAPASGAGGSGFESRSARHFVVEVAQLVERRVVIPQVASSSLVFHPTFARPRAN